MFNVKHKFDDIDIKTLVRRWPRISKEVRQAKLEKAAQLLQRNIQEKTPLGVGVPVHLRSSIISNSVTYGRHIQVGTKLKYGMPVEVGAKKHWPPWGEGSSLKVWVERKLGVSSELSNVVSFLIARKISKRGTKGAYMFEKGFVASHPKMRRILEETADEILRKVDQ